MWFLSRLEPDSTEYLVPLVLRMRGTLDTEALHTAWQHLCARHEILRTRYALHEGEPVQVIDPVGTVALPVTSLDGDTAEAREAAARAALDTEMATPFDLAEQWPVRARVLRLAEDDHVLAVVFHHIACDAWSTRVFGQELSAVYTAALDGREPQLPPVPLQYADYAAWERRELAGEGAAPHLAYWRERLAGLEPTELPTDRPRPDVRDHAGADVGFELPQQLSDRLREVAGRYDTTPFTVLLTAFQALVSRYTGRTDVPVGTVVSGRNRPEFQGMFGYGINSLVMRARWEGAETTFGELLTEARQDVLDAFDHQSVPFARLVDELQPERDQSRTPLYQVAFTMHEWRMDSFTLPGLTVEPFHHEDGIAKCDLTLQVQEHPEGPFQGRLVYATSLFDEETARRLTGHFRTLLEQALGAPDTAIARFDILGEEERALVTAGPSAGRGAGEHTVLAHELFEAAVADAPSAVAVVAGGTELSYAEVNARANRLAHLLRGAGVRPEDMVGVHLERGVELIPALLGVLKSGAGYLPLDPANPVERLGYVLGDAGAGVVVTTSDLAPGLSAVFDGRLIVLDDAATVGELAQQSASNPVRVSSPENVIYTIYTSGSTGRPKGVVLSHTNVVRLLSTAREHLAFGAGDVWSMAHSYAFDVSVFEMWGALAHGGRLVVVPRAVTRSPEEFLDLLVQQRVTVLSQTPSAFGSLVGLAGAGDTRIDELALRAVIFAGEKLEMGELRPWTERVGLSAPVLVNMYGITETTVHTTYHEVGTYDAEHPALSRVGHPLSDLAVYLLDAEGRPVPVGVPGEMYVSGPGVARGYLGRAALTAERFVPDPFGAPGARMYRSGDVALRRADGSLEVLGRIDDQVKIRGFRIELGEISAALMACAGVRQAVTVVREDTPGDKRLVAYLVPAEGAEVSPADLRTELLQTLPEYMVPAAFVELETIPLTTNGKLDKRALPAPAGAALRSAGAFTAPRNDLERRIAGVWQSVLGVDQVGAHDSFFELGGDSLRAVALVGELREAGFEVTVRDIFDVRTVARLAELTGEAREQSVTQRLVRPFELIAEEDRSLLPEDVVDAYPLGQNQLGMVVEMLTDDTQNNYHNVSSYWIRDAAPFSAEAFAAAGRVLVGRHEALRTSLHLSGYSRPLQLVHRQAEMVARTIDLTALDKDAVWEEVRRFATAERAHAFDMTVPGLMRYHAHTTNGDGWWLSITECHPIMEGWSYHSLIMELLTTYFALRDGREPEYAGTPDVRFADAIAAELAALESEEDRAYWDETVRDYAPLHLPEDWGDQGAGRFDAHKAAFSFRHIESGLRALAAATETSLKAVMVAAHLKVLSQLTAEEDFHTGLVCDIRPEMVGADRVAGMYLNTLPFPFRRGAGTWGELVRRVFDAEVRMWGHRRYPMPTVQRAWGGSGRMMDVYFNYHDFRQVDTDLIDIMAGNDDSPTEFPLTVSSRSGHIILTANRRWLDDTHIHRLVEMYGAVLEAMAAEGVGGDAIASRLPAGERELMTAAAADAGEPVASLAHELFEAAVADSPDAIAVVAGGTELSYEEVNAWANRLAHLLRGAGVGPEDMVGVHLERGVELIPALLGVLKSGAGYLPLDPANPVERLGYVLGDAGARVVVTTSELVGELSTVFDGRLIVLDDAATQQQLAEQPSSNPARVSSPENVIYTIYTSGSTGRPKGVVLTHANVVRLLSTAREHLAFGAGDVWSMAHSYAFDVSVFEMWGALAHGGRLVVVPRAVTRSPEEFLDLLVQQQVTVLSQTPSAFGSLVGLAGAGDTRIDALSLRAVIFAGEKLEMGELRPWTERLGLDAISLVNMYGITETTVHTTYHRIDGFDAEHPALSRVGYPLSDLAVYLLDAQGQPVPVGIPGEMYVSGPGVARGYLGRPALTAERFVPDPFGAPGARMYRSGDVALRRADGSLEVLGRIDDQVKIRGFRIELGEISAALMACAHIRQAVTVVREDAPGDKRLVAYVVPEGEVSPADLRTELLQTLPEYMVPAAFVELESIPLTTNGKLDKRALPEPAAQQLDQGRYVAPRTPAEARMAAVWAEAVGAERVGVEDDFFALGGDSLRAVTLVGSLRAAGFEVSVRDVFEHTTVAALCAAATGREVPRAPLAPVQPFALISDEDRALLPDGLSDAYPLSQNQTGMLVETLASGERGNYHDFISFLVRDDNPFDFGKLTEAVRIVAEQHDILRTSAALTGFSVPMQLVHAEVDIPLAWRDISHLDADEQQAELVAFAAAERAKRFDLNSSAPLLRIFFHVQSPTTWRCSFTKNHAVLEGWSYHTLLKDLVDVYGQLCAGGDVHYEAPQVRFADTIAAELEALASAEQREFWQDIVDGHARFTLPDGWHGDLDAPAQRVGAAYSYRHLEPKLRGLAAAAGVPMKAVLHAAHLKVLSQLSGEERFFTGLVGHTRPEVDGADRLMGMYITTLPHPHARTARTWGDLVREVFDREAEAWPYRSFPLQGIQSEGQRLLDVFFIYLDFHNIGDDEVVDEGNGINRTETEFGLAVTTVAGQIGLRSNTHVLTQANVERLVEMYGVVLEAMAAEGVGGDAIASRLPAGEREVMTAAAADSGEPVVSLAHELFEAAVADSPSAIAVVAGGTELSYAEVNARANRLAHLLRGAGVRPEDMVGLHLERGVELIPALLGILKSGAGYLPLDPANPVERLGYVLGDAGAKVVVTTSELVGELSTVFDGRLIVLDDPATEGELAQQPVSNPVRVSSPENVIYTIYTSGSTGRPKGVVLSHANVVRLLSTAREHLEFGAGDVWSMAHSYAFDVSVFEMWGALAHGGRLVVVPRAVTRSPEEFLDLLTQQRVTVLSQTPSAFGSLVGLAGAGDTRIDALSLRAVIFAGEKLEMGELRPWTERLGLDAISLVNMYGITETTVHTTYHEVDTYDVEHPALSRVGHPLADLAVYLLDAQGHPVPVDVPGEMYVSGPGVARGYLGRPALTAERFVPDPFGAPGARMYRSGDVALRRADGSLEVLGRIDDQVKIRGFRIELGEISAALMACAHIRQAVTLVREDTPGDKRLVAYVVPESGPEGEVSPAELRAELLQTLPEYMVPAAFVELEAIPLTTNGKLDKRALPAPDAGSLRAAGAFVAPRNPLEQQLAAVWAEVLGLETLGVEDSYFDLGGDSIRAVALVGAVRAAGHDVSVADVFEQRTVARLAALIGTRGAPAEAYRPVAPFELISAADRALLPDGLDDAYPLTQVQTGMLYEQQSGARAHYHSTAGYKVRDQRPLDEAALRAALREVAARHEALRTSFDLSTASTPLQLVHSRVEVPFAVHDLRGLDAAETERALERYVAEESCTPLDPARAPQLRMAAHLADDGWWLSLTRSHMVTEGWSQHSMLMELIDCYRALADGREPVVPEPAGVRFADTVAAELAALAGTEDRAYWQRLVDTHAPLTLPADWAGSEGASEAYSVTVPVADLEGRLRALATESGASVKSVLLAAHLKVLGQLTHAERFHTGLVVDVRPEVQGADRVHGMFLNTLPFPYERGARTWGELVRQVFDAEVGLWPHRRFPLPEVQRLAGGASDRLIDVIFNYRDFHNLDAEQLDLGAGFGSGGTEFALTVGTGGSGLVLKTHTGVLTREATERLAGMYRQVLEAMAEGADGEARAVRLPHGDAERLESWSTAAPMISERPVPAVLGERAARVPGAVAVEGDGFAVSFGELEARANRWARHLRDVGVGAGSVVGVLLDRGPDLHAVMLGVWKAGAAFVPLDPAFPAARIGTMLEDAGARVLVTGSEYATDLREAAETVVDVEGEAAAIAACDSAPLDLPVDPESTAYVIFTSGSTGRPKGVAVSHRGLANHVAWAARDLAEAGAAHGGSGGAVFSSVAFDLVVPNVWAPLVAGQRVVMLPQEMDLSELGERLIAAGPFAFLKLTPGHLEILSEQLTVDQARDLAGVVVVAGEALPAPLAQRWTSWLGAGRLINEYGPTEASVGTCIHPVPTEVRQPVVPIGAPLPGMTMRILDPHMAQLPIGATGELFVGGTGVAHGYLNRPALTAERFVPDPYGAPGSRLYRTGDLARWLADGTVEFLGRTDDQVKIRGHRIEIPEIESVLQRHSAVREARVTVYEDAEGGKRLIAYVVAGQQQPLDTTELEEHCSDQLPPYMVPSAFVPLDSLPLNANGKLDRTALPAPDGGQRSGADAGPGFVAPVSEAEADVVEVWQQVLRAERIGTADRFFDLGGDSIRAVGVVGALRGRGYEVSVRDVFEQRTPARLAAVIEGRARNGEERAATAPYALISEADRRALPEGLADAYPLGQVQLGMVAELLSGNERNNYHSVIAKRITDDGPFDQEALRAAVRTVAARHDSLRTSVRVTGHSVPLQLVHAQAEIPVQVIDLRGTGEEEGERELRAHVAAERARLFDLTEAPLLRVSVLLESDEAWWLTLTTCHVIIDGWSTQNLEMELLFAYREFRDAGAPAPYPPLPVRYADTVAAELAALRSPDTRGYWQRVVDEYAVLTPPSGWAGQGRPAPLAVDVPVADLAERLRQRAAEADVPFKTLMLAVHLKVMSQVTDASAFHTGVVFHGRPEAVGAERVIGMHLNTLPFPYERGSRTWRELLTRVLAHETAVWTHRHFPLPAIQRELGGGQRLAEVFFNFVDFYETDGALVDKSTGISEAPNEFGLAVHAHGDRKIGLRGSTELIGQEAAERLGAMYRAVLESLAEDVDGDATALHPHEATAANPRQREISMPTDPAKDIADGTLVHELFEAAVADAPDAIAVVAGGTELSYAEVNARANRLAHLLRDAGVRPEDMVGLHLERGSELIPALLGILKSGAGYLPLDPANPVERLGYVLGDAGARTVVTSSDLVPVLSTVFDGRLVVLDDPALEGELAQQPASDPVRVSSPENVIYTIYTSGSTGRPKGVVLTHANVVRLLSTAQEHFAFDEADVWSMAHSYAFDVSVFEMWGALAHGGRLVVVPRSVTRSPEEFLDLLVEQEVTVLSQTPSAFGSLVGLAGAGDRRVKGLSLRAVIFAGEKLELGQLTPWTDKLGLGRISLVNMYGITETTVHTTYHRLTKKDFGADGNPIGRPLSDLTVHLLDADGRPVPDGVAGEMYVSGPGVARGYLGRAALTAERFVPDPFGAPGARMYRSGDLAQRRPDGSLEFLGRIDDQVKIRGFRIELGEITAALAECEGVRRAVTVVREDTPGDKRLVGYLVPEDDRAPDARTIRETLATTLPEYMVPAAFVELESIPLTTNGKLDKRALPAPDAGSLRAAGEFVAPRTPLEEQVAAIWQSVLGVDRVGLRDGFFELGGDSIRSVLLVGTLRDAGISAEVRDLMERPVLEDFCALLAGREGAGVTPPVEPFALLGEADLALLPDGLDDAYPLTRSQLGMQIEMLAAPENPAYHLVKSMRVRDGRPFAAAVFQKAVDTLVAGHDVLRTSVHLSGYSQALQLVHSDAALTVEVEDLDGATGEAADRLVREHVDRLGRTALPQDACPLLRLSVLLCGDGSWQLTAAYAHVILDGWSLQQMLTELMGVYHGLLDGVLDAQDAGVRTRTPKVRFADTVAAELAALESEASRDYWRGQVAGQERFRLPDGWGEDGAGDDRPADAGDEYADEALYVLPVSYEDIGDGLRGLAARAHAPLKSVLLAAHLAVLARLTPEDAFLSGLTHHVRPEAADADRVHGMFLNVLPLRHRRGARSWRELVAGTFATEREMWTHRHFPMPAIQREFGGGERLLEVYFSYQDFGSVEDLEERGGITVDASAGAGSSHNEFGFSVSSAPGRLQLRCAPGTVSRANGQRLAALYRQVLEAMAADAEGDPRDLELPYGERQVLGDWETASEGAVSERPVPMVLGERAARVPGAVAVEGDGFAVSFGELEARANRVARHLRDVGVGVGSVVGVLLDRGPELHAVLLGVWKAGAAFVPLDPAFPAARIGTMLSDAGARVLVTGSAYAGELRDAAATVVDVEGEADAIAAQESAGLDVTVDPESTAYVIFTSGSTGRPKGVAVSHRGLANHVAWAARDLAEAGARRGGSGGAVFSSVAFDLVVPNVWAPLVAGQRVVMLPQEMDLSELGERLVAAGPFAFLKLTPGHLEILSQQLTEGQARGLAGVVVVAGEALPAPLAQRWTSWLGAGRLINEYGPTEASVGTCIHPVPTEVRQPVVPIGAPLPGMTMRILDAHMRQLPVGATGELFVGGTGVAHGYLNRPALTAERFVPDPYGAPGARLYRTGDLARWLADGTVEFLGRTDDQVKIRGHRIETGEVRTVLTDHPAVREAAVLGREHAPGDVRLVAYVVPADPAAPPASSELAAHCAEKLPAYMVPSDVTLLESIPLNANGKVDRRALPEPGQDDVREEDFAPPATGTEERLARIWCEVLGVEKVGREDGFFARGGHSILVIQAVAAAQREDLPLTLFMLYQHETLSAVAAALDAALDEAMAEAMEEGADEAQAEADSAQAGKQAEQPAPTSWWTEGTLPDTDFVHRILDEHRVPGASVAVIHDGELVAAEGYGTAAGETPVRADTPFQVGSLSKHITALGVLRLVDRGVLVLDGDVNDRLTTWKVPTEPGQEPVTVRHLLGHRAALSPTPGNGFPADGEGPSLLDLLDGSASREVPPVARDGVPGERFRKANVNYCVLQQLVEDVTGQPFAQVMRELVLEPLGMRDSGFGQDFPYGPGRTVAAGHGADGTPYAGGWRIRPDAAAAGMWSTAVDLAKAALEVRRSALGRPGALLRKETAEAMLTPSPLSLYGLGTAVDVTASETEFGHGGTPVGYHGVSVTRLRARTGFVVLTNGDAGVQVVKALTASHRSV